MPLDRAYRLIALATLVATFLLIVVGAVVRVSGSGLGCSEWPSCEGGNWLPPIRIDALIEVSHRISASVVSVLILLTFLGSLLLYRKRPIVGGLAVGTVVLLIVQIALGGITVLLELPEEIVTIHLGTALAIFGVLVVLNLAFIRPRGARPLGGGSRPGRYFWLTVGAAAAVYAVLLSGAYVRGHGAASACGPEWPLCQGSLWPINEMTAVHLGHRYLVAIVGGLIGWAVVAGWRRRRQVPAIGHAAATLGAVYLLQILVGAANPLSHLAPFWQAAHLGVATLVWGAAVALATIAWWLAPDPVAAIDRAAGAVVSRPVVPDTHGS